MDNERSIWEWLATDEGSAAVCAIPESPTPALIASLRKRYAAEQILVASQCAKARAKGIVKFDSEFASGLIGDIASVEMASTARSSLHKANRMIDLLSKGGTIADLCCGIGGDSWGFLQAGLCPIGVELDSTRAWMYQHNTKCPSVCGDAIADCPGDIQAFHLDPARRNVQGKRTLDIEDFSPNPEQWAKLLESHPTGAIKLHPGVNAYDLPVGELEVISEPAGLTQAVLWTGELAGDHERRATLLSRSGECCTIAGMADRPVNSSPIEQYLGALDPCLERADLVGVFLDQAQASLVHPGTGLVTACELVEHPMVKWYEVLDVLAWSRKKVRAAVRDLDAGIVEIRTRGRVIDPDAEQRYLRGKGKNHALTVFIYRIDQQTKAIIGRHIQPVEQRQSPSAGECLRGTGEERWWRTSF